MVETEVKKAVAEGAPRRLERCDFDSLKPGDTVVDGRDERWALLEKLRTVPIGVFKNHAHGVVVTGIYHDLYGLIELLPITHTVSFLDFALPAT